MNQKALIKIRETAIIFNLLEKIIKKEQVKINLTIKDWKIIIM